MILTDVDGVLLDWFSAFRAFLKSKDIVVSDIEPETWSMAGWAKVDDIQPLIAEFNSSWRFSHIPHYVSARSQLRRLCIEGHEIVAITSCSDNPEVHAMRKENLENKFGKIFKDIICLPLMGDKTQVLKTYAPAFWIEDSEHGALAGVEAGHKTFLLDKPYNQKLDNPVVTRVDHWYEIYERIKNSRS